MHMHVYMSIYIHIHIYIYIYCVYTPVYTQRFGNAIVSGNTPQFKNSQIPKIHNSNTTRISNIAVNPFIWGHPHVLSEDIRVNTLAPI